MGRPGSATTLHYNGSPRTVFSGGQAGGRGAGGRAGPKCKEYVGFCAIRYLTNEKPYTDTNNDDFSTIL